MRDVKAIAKQLRENLRKAYGPYFDQHLVYFQIQERIEARLAGDVGAVIDGFKLEELKELADVWGEDGKQGVDD